MDCDNCQDKTDAQGNPIFKGQIVTKGQVPECEACGSMVI